MSADHQPAQPAESSRASRILLRLAHAVLPEGDLADAIYGTLIAAAVLAAKAREGESGAGVVWSAVLVLVLYWVAHVYADVVAERLSRHARPGWSEIVSAALRDASLLRGAFAPVVVFEVVRLFGASLNASALAALWVTVALLAAWGFVAAHRGGSRGRELAVETLVCASLGVAVVALKAFIK